MTNNSVICEDKNIIQRTQVFHALAEGNYTLRSIQQATGFSIPTIKKHISVKDIKEYKARIVTDLIAQGVRSVDDLYAATNFSFDYLNSLVRTSPFREEFGSLANPSPRNELLDGLIAKGETLERTAELSGKTYNAVRWYIAGNGLETQWKDAKEQRKIRKKEMLAFEQDSKQKLSNLVLQTVFSKAEQLGQATQQATRYIYSRRRYGSIHQRFSDAITLFENLYRAKEDGRALSLAELAKGTHLEAWAVSDALREVGEPTLIKNDNPHKRIKITPKIQRLMQEAEKTTLPFTDLEYFTGLSRFFLRKHAKERERLTQMISKRPYIPQCTFRMASQVYEGIDAGLTPVETRKVLDISSETLKYLLELRVEIEPVIVDALQRIFQDSHITTPYIDTSYRQEFLQESS